LKKNKTKNTTTNIQKLKSKQLKYTKTQKHYNHNKQTKKMSSNKNN